MMTLLLTGAFLGFAPSASAQAPPPPAGGVPNVSIPGISQADFNALFPDDPICALGKLLSAADKADDTDTLYFAGIFIRLQSATYVGTGAAAGKFAYVYQLDCTGGLGAATKVTIPFSGGGIDAVAFGAPFTYMATIHEDPAFCLSTFPDVPLFAGNLTNFNLSELGGVSGLGGTTGDGFTTAVTVGAGDVLADSGDSIFWSGSLLVVVTDRPPVVSHATVAVHDDLAAACFDSPVLEGSDKVIACVPTPAPPLPQCSPTQPPPCFVGDEIIEPPPPANNPPEAVCRDIERLADDHCHVHVHQEDIDGGSFDPDGDTIAIHATAVDGVPLSPPVHDFTLDGAGTHSAELTVVDDNGASDACIARIEVVDRTVPQLECPAPPVLECSSGGARAEIHATAHDNCDPDLGVACTVESGVFPLGTTDFSCSATDDSGNTASCRSSVTVVDSTPPQVECPAPQLLECSNGGAPAEIQAHARDTCEGDVRTACTAESGVFPLGPTDYTCTATDTSGNSAMCSSSVRVVDTLAPSVSCVESVNPSGNNVPSARKTNEDGFYMVSVSDRCDQRATIMLGSYALTAGETIKLTQSPGASGVTLVNTMGPLQIKHFRVGPGDPMITAIDASGNTSTATCLVPPPPK